MPRPKKRKTSPLESPPPTGASGDGTPQTHPWVAPEPEADPPQPAEPQVEAEPETEPPPQKTEAEKALDDDKAYDDLEKARKEHLRLFWLYSDSEFDSQWGDNAFYARVQERVAASESKLSQAEATYLEAAIAAEKITPAEIKYFRAQAAVCKLQMHQMCASRRVLALQAEKTAYLSDLAS